MKSCEFFCALFFLASILPGTALWAAAPTDAQETLDTWLSGKPGGVAVAYVEARGITFLQSGKFSPEDPRQIDADTLFEIGSLTKVFTALLLAESVRAGKVALDGTVGVPFAPNKITYSQLATHTSGLPRLPPDFRPELPLNPYKGETLSSLVAGFDRLSAQTRESGWAYSNFGFAVLGQALAGAWGEPYEKLLAGRVLGPLGMSATKTNWRDADPSLLAPGHTKNGEKVNWDMAAYAPAGCLISSARDLAQFVQEALEFRRTPLTDALAEIARPLQPLPEGNTHIGLAWLIVEKDGAALVHHAGETGGYQSFVGYNQARGVGVVVLANQVGDAAQLGFGLLTDTLENVNIAVRKEGGPTKKELIEYLGTYPITPDFVLTVSASGSNLAVQATGQPKLALREGQKDRFSIVGVTGEIVFERDEKGKIAALNLRQKGIQDQRARRVSSVARKETTLDPTVLADYPGRYPISPAFVLTVTLELGTVFVQATGQPKFSLTAQTKDEFFLNDLDAQITFTRNAKGRVDSIILHQGGRDTPGKREE